MLHTNVLPCKQDWHLAPHFGQSMQNPSSQLPPRIRLERRLTRDFPRDFPRDLRNFPILS